MSTNDDGREPRFAERPAEQPEIPTESFAQFWTRTREDAHPLDTSPRWVYVPSHTIEDQLERIRRMPFSKRRVVFDALQEIVSIKRGGAYAALISYPDVFLFATVESFDEAIARAGNS